MHDFIVNGLLAAGIALLVSIAMGPFMIPFLTRLKVGQSIRDDGPERHLSKAGTPTMGGIIIITAIMVASFVMAGSSQQVLVSVSVMLAVGALGFVDDYIKVVLKRSLGLRARDKLFWQSVIGLLLGFILVYYLGRGTEIIIPFSGSRIDLGYFYIPFVMLVLISCTNGVNLTDGLDGLASGVTLSVVLAFALISIMMGHFNMLVFCGALMGACLGFLVFNHYPARVFMGDTGSLAIGGAITAIAAINRAEIALIIIGGVYVIEVLSDIIQVASFKTTGKRVFLMAPLHHHFELKGWSERKVVWFFSLLSLGFALLGLLGYKNIG
ncbi:Phospho-N-acetylmuramoyl-pentapeptide transferase [Syntrophomonas zehnderi OL-4]|uniref:Phospho-N-acetylmuramoyl-pentapeptide-transferase n=1 Tax=Syntrophomonas zehnderi OL-4 TaxID=690567 RepID=A0A0E4GAP4_9FIRM|nr:phospho-N-acetylmuramoyl-pentapeptide-transferase [Syntrophomonas zehnderi]CFX62766.1 Phospho-N-acetylmuramoyl-pentapeptide transferase [Syntrophomonas zehnderi OL-4]